MPVSVVVVGLGDVGLRRGATVIVESTSCPGTTQEQGAGNPCGAPEREQQNAGSQPAVHSPAG